MSEMNFGYDGDINSVENNQVNPTQEERTDLNGEQTSVDINEQKTEEPSDENQIQDEEVKTSKYEEGTILEIGDTKYTIDKNGNVLDETGNIFKNSNEVEDWLKTFEEITDDSIEINLNNIQEAIGVSITDENNNPIEFENNIEGVKSYINAVLDSKREENYDVAINTLFQKYPILEDTLNYYLANGNTLKGFGEIPDRTKIVIDDDNEAQQIHIIKTAWQEKGISGNVDNYIQYLKTSGTLLETAKEELKGLQESDKKYKEELAVEAERKEAEQIKQIEEYWNGVHEIIKTRQICGYRIPETILINRNGQKISATPEDFFNYIYKTDNEGKSAYQKDLEKDNPQSTREDEILRAYLKFVGGNYSNLVDMAINKQNINTLKFKAAQRTTNKIKMHKPTQTKNKQLDLGYN